jgi:hypothetical protein
VSLEFGLIGKLLFNEVLDRLHIVVSGALNGFDALGIGRPKLTQQALKRSVGGGAEWRHFADCRVGSE